jgi:hypothetical protein
MELAGGKLLPGYLLSSKVNRKKRSDEKTLLKYWLDIMVNWWRRCGRLPAKVIISQRGNGNWGCGVSSSVFSIRPKTQK